MIKVYIENLTAHPSVDKKKVLANVRKMIRYVLSEKNVVENSCLKDYEYKNLEFDVIFCDDEKIAEINKQYRHKDGSTDVISFAIFADSPKNQRFVIDETINLGEIIISLDKTSFQAKENGHNFEKELYYLLSHGILHLLGYDHKDEVSLEDMLNLQAKMSAKII